MGQAIKGQRQRVVLATKFGNIRPPGDTPSADGRPEYVIQACEASLRRLAVDVIDAAQLALAPAPLAALSRVFAVGAVAGERYSAAERRRVEL